MNAELIQLGTTDQEYSPPSHPIQLGGSQYLGFMQSTRLAVAWRSVGIVLRMLLFLASFGTQVWHKCGVASLASFGQVLASFGKFLNSSSSNSAFSKNGQFKKIRTYQIVSIDKNVHQLTEADSVVRQRCQEAD